MRTSRFSEAQIIAALRRQETGEKVRDVCRDLAISEPTFYAWKARYGGMSASELIRAKNLEAENARLPPPPGVVRMYADLSLVHDALKEAVAKKP